METRNSGYDTQERQEANLVLHTTIEKEIMFLMLLAFMLCEYNVKRSNFIS